MTFNDDGLPDTLALPVMYDLLGCLTTELERSPGGTPCFVGVIPGALVNMDYCQCTDESEGCGQAWVRLDSAFPSANFPNQAVAVGTCAVMWASRIQIGVTRCMAGLHEDGSPPTVLDQDQATQVQLGDMAAMIRAMQCCLPASRRDYAIGPYQPIGPQGDCGGGVFTITVR